MRATTGKFGVAVQQKDNLLSELKETFPPSDLSFARADLWAYARDLSVQQTLKARAGVDFDLPLAIVWPHTIQHLQQVVQVARKFSAVLIPYGAGSGVVAGQTQNALKILLDLKNFNEIKLLDKNYRIRVGPGCIGEQLERWLNARRLSLGHFPSSITCSTVGGWVATRSAGQLSSRYGKIEDMLLAAEAIDGQGRRWRFSRDEVGPGLEVLLGSEGGLFIITALEFQAHELSQARLLRGAEFSDLPSALSAMRALIQSGYLLSVLRVYDPLDSLLSGHAGKQGDSSLSGITDGPISCAGLENIHSPEPGHILKNNSKNGKLSGLLNFNSQDFKLKILRALSAAAPQLAGTSRSLLEGRLQRCRMIFGLEGNHDELRLAEPKLVEIIKQNQGKDLGPEPGHHWLARRYGVSYKLSRILEAGLWADTFEVATHWSGVESLYRAVRAAVSDQVLCLAHFSHAYPEGCSIYFTFAGAGADLQAASERHKAVWQAGLQAALEQGAALSHHHGVGQLKRKPFRQSIGPGGRLLLDSLKQSLDPDDILNPGVLGMKSRHIAASDPISKTIVTNGNYWNISIGKEGFAVDTKAGLLVVDARLSRKTLHELLQDWRRGRACQGLFGQGFLAFLQKLEVRNDLDLEQSTVQFLQSGSNSLKPHFLACQGLVNGQVFMTPLVPRAATGPNLNTLLMTLDVPDLRFEQLAFSLWPLPANEILSPPSQKNFYISAQNNARPEDTKHIELFEDSSRFLDMFTTVLADLSEAKRLSQNNREAP